MKTRFLLTLVICASLFASVQAQEFRYGLSVGYNHHSTKENMPKSGFHAGLKGEYAFRGAAKGFVCGYGTYVFLLRLEKCALLCDE